MNGETVVDRLHADFQEIVGKLDPTDISLRNVAEENFRKILLLAAASLFEREGNYSPMLSTARPARAI